MMDRVFKPSFTSLTINNFFFFLHHLPHCSTPLQQPVPVDNLPGPHDSRASGLNRACPSTHPQAPPAVDSIRHGGIHNPFLSAPVMAAPARACHRTSTLRPAEMWRWRWLLSPHLPHISRSHCRLRRPRRSRSKGKKKNRYYHGPTFLFCFV